MDYVFNKGFSLHIHCPRFPLYLLNLDQWTDSISSFVTLRVIIGVHPYVLKCFIDVLINLTVDTRGV